MKISFRQGCKIYATHMEEPMRDMEPSLEDYPVLKEYEYAFEELSGFPPKMDIYLSIDLIPRVVLVCKTPYKMSMSELKELHVQLVELLKKWYIRPSVSRWGAPILFFKKKDGTLRLCIDFR